MHGASVRGGAPHGRVRLDATTLDIAPGERVALIGPSGAGKSTLLAVLAAALRPDAGTVRLRLGRARHEERHDGRHEGRDGGSDRYPGMPEALPSTSIDPWNASAAALRTWRRRLHLAPQSPPLPPRQRVAVAVTAGRLPRRTLVGAVRDLFAPTTLDDVVAALAAVGLEERLWDRVDRLSGGERQRVCVARALVADTAALLLDEPLSALDPERAASTLDALVDDAARRGRTLVCSLHHVDLARSRFERVIRLANGRSSELDRAET